MTKEMFNLINDNYTILFNEYCKNQNKLQIISNSYNCEDLFNDKILQFIEDDVKNPTLNILKQYLRTKKSKRRSLNIEYNDNHIIDDDEIIVDKLKYLFIDYRKK